MSRKTRALNDAVLRALGDSVSRLSSPEDRPLEVDLEPPNPPALRLYVFNVIGGLGTVRSNEYKVNVRLPGGRPGDYSSFDYSGGRLPVLMGYREDLDTFIVWDAGMRDQIKHAGNLQVKIETVHEAAHDGWAVQARRPGKDGMCEIVIACTSDNLLRALNARLEWAGGLPENECPG